MRRTYVLFLNVILLVYGIGRITVTEVLHLEGKEYKVVLEM